MFTKLFLGSILQGIVLDILVALGIIRSHHAWLDVEHIEEALQNLLVCVEMVFFAAFQQYAYNVAPYRDNDTSSVKSDKKKEWLEFGTRTNVDVNFDALIKMNDARYSCFMRNDDIY